MEEQEKIDYYQAQHPEWTKDQAQIRAAIDKAADITVDEHPEVNPNDPELIIKILERSREWIKNTLPEVFERVGEFFNNLINHAGKWIQKGLAYVFDAIEYLYNAGKNFIQKF